jgi:cellulose synthase/poly-beta-1,6-N-acetylglucosamine synthase-like glycosyltransferase
MTLVAAAGILIALATVPGSLELLMLTVGALLPRRRPDRGNVAGFRLAVVVPAHNEELNIGRTVASIQAAAREAAGECITLTAVVVADNCKDATAAAAVRAGARVFERTDTVKRGKGYALDYAFCALLPEGYDGFAVVDADSDVSPNFLLATAAAMRAGADATQCRYLVRNPGASARTRLMKVALLAFNVLRPRGRYRLGLSAGIYGNGFAISAATLRAVPYTAESVVEDLEYHLALVRTGRRVRFIDDAAVYGDMPEGKAGAGTQRARWEGGRFRMLRANAPGLAVEVMRGKLALIEPLFDLLLLPLSFHLLLLVAAAAIPSWPGREIGLAGLGIVAFHLAGAILLGGSPARDAAALATAPFYVLWKILLLPKVIATSRSRAAWVRTERAGENKLP